MRNIQIGILDEIDCKILVFTCISRELGNAF